MADIELVIKIDEKLYKDIYSDAEIMIYGGMRSGKTLLATLLRAIRNGTPLPKGHGRLIILSEDTVKREQTPLSFSCQNWISEVGLSNATVAIIEADTEGK